MGGCLSTSSNTDFSTLQGIDTGYEKVKNPKIQHIDIDAEFEIPHIFTENQLNWSTKSNKCADDANGCVVECKDLHSDCIHIQRIFFVLLSAQRRESTCIIEENIEYITNIIKQYGQLDNMCTVKLKFAVGTHFKTVQFDNNESVNTYSRKHFVNEEFKDYSQVHLVNDYIHLLQYHLDNQYLITDLFHIHNSCVDNKKCISVQRLLNGSIQISSISDIEEMTIIHLFDMIHSNLFHLQHLQMITYAKPNSKFKTNAAFGINTKNTKCSSSTYGQYNNYYFSEGINYFQFAPRFDYVDSMTGSGVKNKKILQVCKKYTDLKNEILNNKLINVTMNEWNFVAYKALIYSQTVYVRENDYASNCELNHLICLILICDFNEIAILLRNSYFRQDRWDTANNLIQRHKEYYHIAKLIKHCVGIFGVVAEKSNQSLFHLIYNFENNVRCNHFAWLRVKWNFPISTVSNLASLENEKTGILIELNNTDGMYFDLRFISRFAFEKEGLFMDCQRNTQYSYYTKKEIITVPLPIRNIENVNDETQMKFILLIHSFIDIINRERFPPKTAYDKHFDTPKSITNDKIIKAIQNKFTSDGNISIYVKNAIKSFFNEKKEYGIDINLLTTKHRFLSDLFLSNSNRIKFGFISYLFPNCSKVTVRNIESLGQINESFIEWLFGELEYINHYYNHTKSNEFSNHKNKWLINGFLRTEMHNTLLPADVINLILAFYDIHCKITTIVFLNSIDENAKQAILSCMNSAPKDWTINVKETTIGWGKETLYAIKDCVDDPFSITLKFNIKQ